MASKYNLDITETLRFINSLHTLFTHTFLSLHIVPVPLVLHHWYERNERNERNEHLHFLGMSHGTYNYTRKCKWN